MIILTHNSFLRRIKYKWIIETHKMNHKIHIGKKTKNWKTEKTNSQIVLNSGLKNCADKLIGFNDFFIITKKRLLGKLLILRSWVHALVWLWINIWVCVVVDTSISSLTMKKIFLIQFWNHKHCWEPIKIWS